MLIEHIQKLTEAGAFHATGLPIKKPGEPNDGRPIYRLARDWGRWKYNNSTLIMVLESGHVFLMFDCKEPPGFITEICPHGQISKGWVPCSNGGTVDPIHLSSRMENPMWSGDDNKFPSDPHDAEIALNLWLSEKLKEIPIGLIGERKVRVRL